MKMIMDQVAHLLKTLDDFTIQVLIDNGCSVGDLNQDNSINIQDIVLMVNVVLGPSDQWNLFFVKLI